MKYTSPEIKDYGDLVALTADAGGMAHLGFGTLAAVSSPVTPTGGGSIALGTIDSGETLGDNATVPEQGGGGAGNDGGVAGDSGSDPSGGGSSGGGGGGGGGAAGKLPFTGFAAAAVAALGAGMASAGAAARKYLARD